MRVLITGAGGTLGRALINYLKEDIIALEFDETKVAELKKQGVNAILGDFGEWEYRKIPCDLIIHCAAYKHVDIGEKDIIPFIENNIYKTHKLFAEAYRNNVDFIFISTDKAVEPISLYGYTKAIGEMLCKYYGGYCIRLANILDSSGSVTEIWRKAIEEGKPLKITDKRMKRFFMSEEDAVSFIWNSYKKGNKMAIPEVEERGLIDIAKSLAPNHPIEEIGIRKGEKLREKMRWSYESNVRYTKSS